MANGNNSSISHTSTQHVRSEDERVPGLCQPEHDEKFCEAKTDRKNTQKMLCHDTIPTIICMNEMKQLLRHTKMILHYCTRNVLTTHTVESS